MISRIIFCTAVLLATAAVILLAIFSPVHRKNQTRSWVSLSFYIQQPRTSGSDMPPPVAPPDAGALIFHRTLTEGPENTSRVVGKAQGFIIPVESFAHSAFNIIYLTFHTSEYLGSSISIQARNLAYKGKEELNVVGGTGAFAFARGLAVFGKIERPASDFEATHHIKLHLKLPNNSRVG